MSDPVTTSRSARESLARGLAALQTDPNVPPNILNIAEPIAQAMGSLHQIERSQGVELTQHAETALGHVRGALAQLQAQPATHPAVANALEAVASSLGLVHQLSKMVQGPTDAPAAAAAPQAAALRATQPLTPAANIPRPGAQAQGAAPGPLPIQPQPIVQVAAAQAQPAPAPPAPVLAAQALNRTAHMANAPTQAAPAVAPHGTHVMAPIQAAPAAPAAPAAMAATMHMPPAAAQSQPQPQSQSQSQSQPQSQPATVPQAFQPPAQAYPSAPPAATPQAFQAPAQPAPPPQQAFAQPAAPPPQQAFAQPAAPPPQQAFAQPAAPPPQQAFAAQPPPAPAQPAFNAQPAADPFAARPQAPQASADPFASRSAPTAPDPFGSPRAAAPAAPAGGGQVINADLGAHSPTNFYKGLSGNDIVDHGGLFIATYMIPKIGSPVRVRVSLPGGYEFEAGATVRWARDQAGSSDNSQPGFGAQFTDITAEARQLIYRYVRNREPLFHDDL